MNDMSSAEAPKYQPEVEQSLATEDFLKAAEATTINRLRNLVPEKARHALRLFAQKAALTASGLYLLISSGCGNFEILNTNLPSIPEQNSASAPFSSSTEESQKTPTYDQYLSFENIKVLIDKKGVPIQYILPDGKKVSFDREELENLREKAISSKEPEVIAVIPWLHIEKKHKLSDEHPKTPELLEDVLSEEELKKRGIEIIQADKTNLYIRNGAFTDGAPLSDFKSGDRKLTIVLIDGPMVSPYFMSDPKYAEVVKKLDPDFKSEELVDIEQIEQYKAKRQKWLERGLETSREDLEAVRQSLYNTEKKTEIVNEFEERILALKVLLQIQNEGTLGDYYFIEEILMRTGLSPAGSYEPRINIEGDFEPNNLDKNPVVFIAVKARSSENIRNHVIYFDNKGNVATYVSPVQYLSMFMTTFSLDTFKGFPSIRQTHPNLEYFENNKLPAVYGSNSYLYRATTPGQVLRHEVEHEKLIGQKIIGGGFPDSSERNADIKAMEKIASAWERWEDSGFTDNSGYYFVFSLPEGGYILTENKPSSGSTAPGKF